MEGAALRFMLMAFAGSLPPPQTTTLAAGWPPISTPAQPARPLELAALPGYDENALGPLAWPLRSAPRASRVR